ncbi:cysteine dioxygenase [Embleya sp. NPDC050154]|uniref:cysteine dioxygenase n=1 Tax=unclassified Embleya TaxID=2699296 RepID=UPI0037A8E94A
MRTDSVASDNFTPRSSGLPGLPGPDVDGLGSQTSAAVAAAAPSHPSTRSSLDFVLTAVRDRELVSTLRLDPEQRTWSRLPVPGGGEAWLIGWPPGSSTGFHDHGGARGAFAVARGELTEQVLRVRSLPIVVGGAVELEPRQPEARLLRAGRGRAFGASHVHDVRNRSDVEHAISVHVYSPALPSMRHYLRVGNRLTLTTIENATDW